MKIEDFANFVVTEVVCGYSTETAPERIDQWHVGQHLNWTLIFKYKGATYYNIDGKRYISDASSVVLVPKHCFYYYCCYDPGLMINIAFEIAQQPKNAEILFLKVQDKEKVLWEFQRIIDAINRGASNVERLHYFYALLHMLAQQNVNKPNYVTESSRERIRPVENYINQYYYNNINNEQLAKLCGLSTQYFRKIFTEVYGVSPMAYVSRVRMQAATEILKFGQFTTIADVAERVGFHDVYHFSKTFKKYIGISPKKFADQNKKGN